MGAEAFDGRVRDGIGSGGFAWATRPAKINGARLGFRPSGPRFGSVGPGVGALPRDGEAHECAPSPRLGGPKRTGVRQMGID